MRQHASKKSSQKVFKDTSWKGSQKGSWKVPCNQFQRVKEFTEGFSERSHIEGVFRKGLLKAETRGNRKDRVMSVD